MKLVIVSNRIARGKPGEPMMGGLAAALLPVVEKSGAIWVGSSGTLREGAQSESFAKIESLGNGALATLDLPAEHYAGFYEGFANSALWPALHSRMDLIRASAGDFNSYCAVNAFMARSLLRFQQPDTMFWVQDYHFLTLGAELRKLGVTQPIGFFLHTPWPAVHVAASVPHHRELAEAMLAFDLIGFQTDEDRDNFADYLRQELGTKLRGDLVASRQRASRLATFPIGIDPEQFAQYANKAASHPQALRLRMSLNGARLAIGVDRLDYSKGLHNRIRAFDRMLEIQPTLKRHVGMLQIAVPSRGVIEAYEQLQADVARLVSDVNGRHGEVDWTPIRYLNKGYGQNILAGLYRSAQVGLVTPLQDGMNLVAKEYVAAQNPSDPGVLVLSRFAGAACELDSALIVNPYDIDAVAFAVAKAFDMPLEERKERWQAMMARLRSHTIHDWAAEFQETLAATERIALPSPEAIRMAGWGAHRSRAASGLH